MKGQCVFAKKIFNYTIRQRFGGPAAVNMFPALVSTCSLAPEMPTWTSQNNAAIMAQDPNYLSTSAI